MNAQEEKPFVSRGGLKLQHALDAFSFDVNELVCADFGCSVGGFTDCLRRNGASHVYSIDTAYGVLDYRLRTDDRITVIERTNVLHCDCPVKNGVDLVVVDAGWTTQARVIPQALKWIHDEGAIITLIKPHYEYDKMSIEDRSRIGLDERKNSPGILEEAEAEKVFGWVVDEVNSLFNVEVARVTKSPIRGGGKRGKRKAVGNIEYLALLTRLSSE